MHITIMLSAYNYSLQSLFKITKSQPHLKENQTNTHTHKYVVTKVKYNVRKTTTYITFTVYTGFVAYVTKMTLNPFIMALKAYNKSHAFTSKILFQHKHLRGNEQTLSFDIISFLFISSTGENLTHIHI